MTKGNECLVGCVAFGEKPDDLFGFETSFCKPFQLRYPFPHPLEQHAGQLKALQRRIFRRSPGQTQPGNSPLDMSHLCRESLCLITLVTFLGPGNALAAVEYRFEEGSRERALLRRRWDGSSTGCQVNQGRSGMGREARWVKGEMQPVKQTHGHGEGVAGTELARAPCLDPNPAVLIANRTNLGQLRKPLPLIVDEVSNMAESNVVCQAGDSGGMIRLPLLIGSHRPSPSPQSLPGNMRPDRISPAIGHGT